MKVSELTGPLLDLWVAKSAKIDVVLRTYSGVKQVFLAPLPYQEFPDERYSPSTDWSQGGPIIEREDIAFSYKTNTGYARAHIVHRDQVKSITHYGDTKLIAAMRCYVASKFGEEVADE